MARFPALERGAFGLNRTARSTVVGFEQGSGPEQRSFAE
jgi:hypothetical protein